METERIELSARERERLKVLQQVEEGHLQQMEAARRLRLSHRQVRRLQQRWRREREEGIVHRLRGRRSNRKIPDAARKRAITELRQARYAGFGPTLAGEPLARAGLLTSREALRQWMSAEGLWQPRKSQARACVAAAALLSGRVGDDGQLPVRLAGRTRAALSVNRHDR